MSDVPGLRSGDSEVRVAWGFWAVAMCSGTGEGVSEAVQSVV